MSSKFGFLLAAVAAGLTLLVASVMLSSGDARSAGDPITRGLAFLSSSQNPNGSWGEQRGTAFRDTTSVLDALQAQAATGSVPQRGLAWLSSVSAGSHDDLARHVLTEQTAGKVVTPLVNRLLAGQDDEVQDPAGLNFPEGGWGLAPGYATEPLTTALALRALAGVGMPTGLAVVRAQVTAPVQNRHTFAFPSNGGGLAILVREVTGQIRIWIDTPTRGTFYVDLSQGSTPVTVNLGGIQEPGTYTLRVESRLGSPNTYSFEVRFQAGTFDVGRITRALSYLGFAQQPDGGWPVGQGQSSHFMTTAEVLLTLARYGDSIAPSTIRQRAAAWLEGKQNPDGGFGSAAGVSTAYETGLAMLAIKAADPGSPTLVLAGKFLWATQGSDGGWNGRPYDTALAVQALATVPPLPKGDANRDQHVTMTDALLIAQVVVGLRPASSIDQKLADVNCTGTVTMTDALLIARRVVFNSAFPC